MIDSFRLGKMTMKKLALTWLQISLLYFGFSGTLKAQSISGQIEAGKRVKKLIVYLQLSGTASQNAGKMHQVSQKDTRFHPNLTVIAAGDKVLWLNDESKEIDHNIFSLNPLNRFDLGLGERGSKLSQKFDNTGVLNYYCSVHKEMEGKIVVLPSRHYQLLDSPGAFKIDNLPEGKWTLNAIVFHRRYKAEPVEVTIGKQPLTNLTLKIVKR